MDLNIRLKNGMVLRGVIKSPGSDIKALIIMVHGLGEHIRRYVLWAEWFSSKSIGFLGVDLPGHGKSDGKRGHIRSYNHVYEMIDILLAESKKTFPGVPVFLYGHSLGGGIVINFLIDKAPEIRGAIVSSPWIRLAYEPDRIKIKLASIAKNFIPGLSQPNGLNVDHISNDKEVVKEYINDPLVHDKISVSLVHEAFRAGARALEDAHELKTPMLLIHGSDDKICSPEGSREFASKTKMAELKIWEGGYHELHNEIFKRDVFNFVADWINKKVES